MAKGTVKWFNNAKGYGFIVPEDGGDDLFVHYSYVNMEGYRTLKAGQAVEYETQEAPKGLHAINIVPAIDQSAAEDKPSEHDQPSVEQSPVPGSQVSAEHA